MQYTEPNRVYLNYRIVRKNWYRKVNKLKNKEIISISHTHLILHIVKPSWNWNVDGNKSIIKSMSEKPGNREIYEYIHQLLTRNEHVSG